VGGRSFVSVSVLSRTDVLWNRNRTRTTSDANRFSVLSFEYFVPVDRRDAAPVGIIAGSKKTTFRKRLSYDPFKVTARVYKSEKRRKSNGWGQPVDVCVSCGGRQFSTKRNNPPFPCPPAGHVRLGQQLRRNVRARIVELTCCRSIVAITLLYYACLNKKQNNTSARKKFREYRSRARFIPIVRDVTTVLRNYGG